MGRKLPADQIGVFPGQPNWEERNFEKVRVVKRELARRAGLPRPEDVPYSNLGNRELKAFGKREEIANAIRDNRITAIEGETGSGKSTQLPQIALEKGYRKIFHLTPRRIMADNLGDRVRSELIAQLGEDAEELVGIHHSERKENIDAPIVVMTPGTFLRTMDKLDELADEPTLVIGDEVHEKGFETQMAIGVSAQRLEQHPNMRLALVSATMGKGIDKAYQHLSDGYIPHIYLEGRPHKLEQFAKKDLTPVEAYKEYGGEHERAIIFTAGKAEIRETIGQLERLDGVVARPLHAKLPHHESLKATQAELRPGQRLIIVATPTAQSGITIPGLTLSIIDGSLRRPVLDLDGAGGVFKQYSAQDEIVQMGGRAGRDVGGGVAILTKPDDPRFGYKAVEDREEQSPAEISNTNLAGNVLLARSLGIDFFTLNDYMLDKAERRRILDAQELLFRLQAFDEKNRITEIGQEIVRFPLRPELGRTLVEAMRRNASGERLRQLAAIVSAVETGGLESYDKGTSGKWKHDIRGYAKDDYIAQLDLFRATRKYFDGTSINERKMVERGYDPKNTDQAHHTYNKICYTLGMESHNEKIPSPTAEDVVELHDYLTAGLFDFAHVKIKDEKMRGRGTRSWYREAFREKQNDRYLSDRSRMATPGPEYLLGMQRNFEKKSNGAMEVHHVVEFVLPTSVKKLAKHVAHLTVQRDAQPPILVNGRLQQRVGVYFGDIKVDDDLVNTATEHTPETREVLTRGIFEKPTQTISELIDIKRELEYLQRLVPPRTQPKIFPNGILTDEWLREKIDAAITPEVDNIYAVDNNLRAMVVREGVSIRTWISEELREIVYKNSPEYIELSNGTTYELYWTEGKPVINRFNLVDIEALPEDGLFLPDGREVLIHQKNHNGDTKKMRVAELIQLHVNP